MSFKQKVVSKVTHIVSRLIGGLSQEEGGGAQGEPFPGMPELARRTAAEGSVLLMNDGVLPLADGSRVALFGRVQHDWFYVGYGSGGDVKAPYLVSPVQGLTEAGVALDEELAAKYENWVKENPAEHGFWAHWPFSHPEMPLADEEIAAAAGRSDVAVVLIGRAAGEDRDNKPRPGSYYLTKEELSLLTRVRAAFEKTVVVLNIGSPMDMSEIAALSPSALLIAWQGGMESGHALADVLTGAREPGGRLTDTIAVSLRDYPSTRSFGGRKFNNYTEDIYVGYRWFETFAEERVLFPFGAGMGYTAFSREMKSLTLSGSEVRAEIAVTNTGSRAGREVAALYMRAPGELLPVPERQLAAFTKTPVLEPGETFTAELVFDLTTLSSFDEAGSRYVTEKGEYAFFLGGDVRSAEPAGTLLLEEEISRPVQSAAAPVRPFMRLTKRDGAPVYEPVPLSRVDLRRRIDDAIPVPAPEFGGAPTVADIKAGRCTVEQFAERLSLEEYEALSRGDFIMNSPLGAKGNAGVLGGVSDSLRAKGVPPVTTTDGPSGIRLSASCSLLPSGMVLASTWDTALVKELTALVGEEMAAKGSDVLLAPGMNIHRHPLAGRNFEYFSEDPLLTGKMAAAYVSGIQSAGVSACPKHFACNNQEFRRNRNDSRLSERALREIYLRGFEIVVKEAAPHFIMTSYNRINGVYGHYNYDLCTIVLRGEWKFEGAVMTDWWMRYEASPEFRGVRDNAYRVRAQVDILMPGDKRLGKRKPDGTLLASLGKKDGMTVGELQRTACNVIRAAIAAERSCERKDKN